MNRDTRSSLVKGATDVENAALTIGNYSDDDTLLASEVRQLRSLTARLNDAAIQMRNIVDRAEARQEAT